MIEQPHFGRRLKKLRLERGMSQAVVAGDGLSTGYLSRLESGERRPTERAVAYLADRLGVEVSAFEQLGGASLGEALASVTSAPASLDTTHVLLKAVEDDEGGDPAARWQALWLVSLEFNRQGDHERELRVLTELVELSDVLKTPELRVRARVHHARCLRVRGDVRTAQSVAAEALDLAWMENLPAVDGIPALTTLISVEAEGGALDDAFRHAQELENEWVPAAAPAQAAEALWTSAVVHGRRGDLDAAQARLKEAIGLLEAGDDLTLWTRLRIAAAAVALQMAPPELDSARHRLSEVEPAVELVGTPVQVLELQSLQAHLAFHEGRLDDARRLCAEVLENGGERLAYRDRVRLSALAGRLMILDGDYDKGVATLQKLGQEATESKNLDLAAQVWQVLATTLAGVHRDPDTTDNPDGSAVENPQ
ncbi:helix-turn-helix domain-containing protein [Streptomyces sp. NPDC048521]|uniref:helix-turn-helix domain-containing protein n=1 Tax=Streptomyces sp. NPDC048521 TaxID=3365566 RepID=UPI0037161EB9